MHVWEEVELGGMGFQTEKGYVAQIETKLPDLQQLVTHKDDKLESLHEKAEQAENQMATA